MWCWVFALSALGVGFLGPAGQKSFSSSSERPYLKKKNGCHPKIDLCPSCPHVHSPTHTKNYTAIGKNITLKMENYAQNSQKRICRLLLWKEYPPHIIPFVNQFLVFPTLQIKKLQHSKMSLVRYLTLLLILACNRWVAPQPAGPLTMLWGGCIIPAHTQTLSSRFTFDNIFWDR